LNGIFKRVQGCSEQFFFCRKRPPDFQIIKKDKLLSKKLYFELIDPETTDNKRDAMEEIVSEKVLLASKYISNQKYFLGIIRKISSEITEHVKVTTDKFEKFLLIYC
jgi:hypothetical protein